jgi:hypothetical protein
MTPSKPVAFSYSVAKDYETCPHKYNLVRRLKVVKDTSFEQSRGIDIHKMFEDATNGVARIPAPYEHYNKIHDKLMEIPGVKFPEYQMAFTTGMELRGWFDRDVWLRAAADLLIVNEDSPVAHLVDYKTGKPQYADMTQLQLTSVCIFNAFPHVKRVKTALLFPHVEKMMTGACVVADANQYWTPFMQTYSRILRSVETNDFPKKPNYLCAKCPVKDCEFNRST